MESDNEGEAITTEDAASGNGPWSILLCGLAGVGGLLANWLFGNQTPGSYLTSCLVFAALMFAILWAAKRNSSELEDE